MSFASEFSQSVLGVYHLEFATTCTWLAAATAGLRMPLVLHVLLPPLHSVGKMYFRLPVPGQGGPFSAGFGLHSLLTPRPGLRPRLDDGSRRENVLALAQEAAAAGTAPPDYSRARGRIRRGIAARDDTRGTQLARPPEVGPGCPSLVVHHAAQEEYEEALEGVADAEEVLKNQLGFPDGEGSKDPGDAQQEGDREGSPDLGSVDLGLLVGVLRVGQTGLHDDPDNQ